MSKGPLHEYYVIYSVKVFFYGGIGMGYSYKKFAGFSLIALATAIIIRILPQWAWYTIFTLLIASICYFLFISFFGR